VSLEMWHDTNEDSHARGEEEGGVGWWAWKHGVTCVQQGQVSSWVAKKNQQKTIHVTWMTQCNAVWQHGSEQVPSKTHNAISKGLLLWFVVYNSIYKCKPIT